MNKINRFKILITYIIQSGLAENQKDLGNKLGYSNESSFSQIINNKVNTPKNFINRLKSIVPQLNEDWLLYGEGEMLKTGINQEVNGDHNTAVAGNNNTVNSEELISRLIKLLEKKDEQIAEKDIQMNRLISLLEERKG
jgi:hypothetical protein